MTLRDSKIQSILLRIALSNVQKGYFDRYDAFKWKLIKQDAFSAEKYELSISAFSGSPFTYNYSNLEGIRH
jgi:hypothetical protein